MSWFVFRTDTVERFFPKEYSFSGYDDISVIPEDAEGYVWFYQVPPVTSVAELVEAHRKLEYVLERIPAGKTVIALTMEPLYEVALVGNDFSLREAIESYNAFLRDASKKYNNLKIIDFSEFVRRYPVGDLLDWRFYFMSQMGLSP